MSLTVATFNIRQRQFTESGEDTGDRAWQNRLAAAAEYVVLSGASLVALQEVDFTPSPTQSQQLATAVSALTGKTWGRLEDTGVSGSYIYDTSVITPLEGGDRVHTMVVDPNASGVRRATWARFRAVGLADPFWVIRTHFPTSTGAGNTTAERIATYRAAANLVVDKANELDGLAIVMGDLNNGTYPQAQFTARGYTDVRGLLPDPVNLSLNSFNAFDPTLDGRQVGSWIDGIFLPSGWRALSGGLVAKFATGSAPPLATPLPSDHMPVVVTVEQLGGPPGPEPIDLPSDRQVRVLAGSLTTGDFVRDITPLVSSCTWSVGLNATGHIEARIPLEGLPTPEQRELRSVLEEGRSYLAATTGSHVIEAGPIQPHEYDAGVVRLAGLGLRSIFEERTVVRASVVRDVMDGTVDDGTSVQRDVLSFSSMSLGTIAKRLVQNTIAMPGGALPVVFQADAPGTGERSWEGFKLANLATELGKLTDSDGGPDIEFRPRFRADGTGIEWQMLTGTAANPLVHSATEHEFDLTVVAGDAADLSVRSDTSLRTNMAWTTGSGQDKALRMSVRTNNDDWGRGYPLRESVASYPQDADQSVLQGYGQARIRHGSRPLTTWTVTIRPTFPALGEFRPGDWCTLHIAHHPWVADGSYRVRIAGFSGTFGSDLVKVTFLPMLEAR